MLRLLLISIFSTTILFAALLKDEIVPVMTENIDYVIDSLKEKELKQDEFIKDIFERFEGVFDFSLMARLSLGASQWKDLSSDERDRFEKHFVDKMKRSFVQRLELYTDEEVVVKEVEEVKVGKATRIYLLTELVGDEKNYSIVYKFHNAGDDSWMIYDVDILDVSLIQTYRSQFDGYLKTHSLDELISWLKEDEDI
ncbi:MAG: ABC transporter substrate-binding protein [Sulfurospirillaceae bacterium]|jgi:phospholipid transport system substrate-binding protein|nr:ABC transporter substrate-binding protein [Sulfurospirillaceae bacterium]